MRAIRKSTSTSLPFLMVDSGDRITGKTGLTPNVKISKNLSSFSDPEGTVEEVGFGIYKLNATSNDLNTLGWLILHAEAPGALTIDEYFYVVNFDPLNDNNLGLIYLDDQISKIPNLVWSENQSPYNSLTGTFGYYLDDKISSAMRSGINVIVQPLKASVMNPSGNGGTIRAFTKNRLKATWTLEENISGAQPRMIIYTKLSPSTIEKDIPSNYFTIQPQGTGSVLILDAPDTYVPEIFSTERNYAYIIKDNLADTILLYGNIVVIQSPD